MPLSNRPPSAIFARAGSASAAAVAALSGLALVVAMIGVYATVAFDVRHRMREIGVRMAFGARASDVFALLLREETAVVGFGAMLGAGVALAGGRLIASMLYGIEPHNPLALAGSALILLAAAFAACSVPAWRAGQIDPAMVLRDD